MVGLLRSTWNIFSSWLRDAKAFALSMGLAWLRPGFA